MMYQNRLRDFFMQQNPWQPRIYNQQVPPGWMPFDPGNGMPQPGKPQFNPGVPNMGTNVPFMGMNAFSRFGGGFGGGPNRFGPMTRYR